MGATRANDFPRQAHESGQAGGDHASLRTDPDDAERDTGIYGSQGRIARPPRTWSHMEYTTPTVLVIVQLLDEAQVVMGLAPRGGLACRPPP